MLVGQCDGLFSSLELIRTVPPVKPTTMPAYRTSSPRGGWQRMHNIYNYDLLADALMDMGGMLNSPRQDDRRARPARLNRRFAAAMPAAIP